LVFLLPATFYKENPELPDMANLKKIRENLQDRGQYRENSRREGVENKQFKNESSKK